MSWSHLGWPTSHMLILISDIGEAYKGESSLVNIRAYFYQGVSKWRPRFSFTLSFLTYHKSAFFKSHLKTGVILYNALSLSAVIGCSESRSANHRWDHRHLQDSSFPLYHCTPRLLTGSPWYISYYFQDLNTTKYKVWGGWRMIQTQQWNTICSSESRWA